MGRATLTPATRGAVAAISPAAPAPSTSRRRTTARLSPSGAPLRRALPRAAHAQGIVVACTCRRSQRLPRSTPVACGSECSKPRRQHRLFRTGHRGAAGEIPGATDAPLLRCRGQSGSRRARTASARSSLAVASAHAVVLATLPSAGLAEQFDVFLPMVYFTYRPPRRQHAPTWPGVSRYCGGRPARTSAST